MSELFEHNPILTKPLVLSYFKLIVIELDPFCESRVVYDKNCNPTEVGKLVLDLKLDFPDDMHELIIKEMSTRI